MNAWYAITLLGTPEFWAGFSLILVGAYFLMRGYGKTNKSFRRFLIVMVPSLFIALFLTQGMKGFLAIPRPCVPCPGEMCNPYCTEDFSFPSAHATTMFAMFTSAFIVSRKYKKHVMIGYIIPLMVSLSRVMLGVHALIDVVGGALIGMFAPVLVLYACRRYELVKL